MSRYDVLRRRILPIVFFLAIGWVVKDSCSRERTHTTVELQFGAAEPRVRGVEVDVMLGDETFATFHRYALPDAAIGPCRFELALPQPDGELRIDVDLGTTRQVMTKRFHVVEGGATLVPIPIRDAQ